MTYSEKTIYELSMHESMQLEGKHPYIKCVRVPGGLLYTTYLYSNDYYKDIVATSNSISTIFVPYKFKDEIIAEQRAKEEFSKHRLD